MIPVCAGVVMKSGMILLCRRAPGRRHAGLWEFPGGRIEDGETSASALKRELKEELGIDAEIGPELARARHVYDFGEIELIAHLVPKYAGAPSLKDHDQFKWVEARKLLEFELAPADVPIAEVVAAHRRRGRYDGTHPKEFADKYKELGGDAEAARKAAERGSTPAGTHIPIMVAEIAQALHPLEGARLLDCTLGWGGHASALARLGAAVVGLDRDGEEMARAEKRLRGEGAAIVAVQSDYADALKVMKGLEVAGFDAVLADLGVSSMQLDRPERGMSFKNDGPLDMRMDRSKGRTAAEWLASSTQDELAEAFRVFGDEPDAVRVAAAIKRAPPKTTYQLSSLVCEAKGFGPGKYRKKNAFSAHPAVRVFQATRIAVNGERESLTRLLADLPSLVRPGGRLALLTFHSGEERLVKASLEKQAAEGLWTSPPAEPRKPSSQETNANPRARSARLWTAVRSTSSRR